MDREPRPQAQTPGRRKQAGWLSGGHGEPGDPGQAGTEVLCHQTSACSFSRQSGSGFPGAGSSLLNIGSNFLKKACDLTEHT